MSASVSLQYAARVAARKIERDSGQQAIVDRLAQLEKRLAERRLAHKSSSLGWLFGAREAELIKGLYIFRRRRPRQDHADGSVLRGVTGCSQAPRPFS